MPIDDKSIPYNMDRVSINYLSKFEKGMRSKIVRDCIHDRIRRQILPTMDSLRSDFNAKLIRKDEIRTWINAATKLLDDINGGGSLPS